MVFGAGAASAQGLDVRIGVGEPGYHRVDRRVVREVYPGRRVVERRYVRPRSRTVCRTVVRERVTPAGFVVRRPTEVCRRVYR
jgi:hypothetical protein